MARRAPQEPEEQYLQHTHREVSIKEAKELEKHGAMIEWRPDGRECAVVLEEP